MYYREVTVCVSGNGKGSVALVCLHTVSLVYSKSLTDRDPHCHSVKITYKYALLLSLKILLQFIDDCAHAFLLAVHLTVSFLAHWKLTCRHASFGFSSPEVFSGEVTYRGHNPVLALSKGRPSSNLSIMSRRHPDQMSQPHSGCPSSLSCLTHLP